MRYLDSCTPFGHCHLIIPLSLLFYHIRVPLVSRNRSSVSPSLILGTLLSHETPAFHPMGNHVFHTWHDISFLPSLFPSSCLVNFIFGLSHFAPLKPHFSCAQSIPSLAGSDTGLHSSAGHRTHLDIS